MTFKINECGSQMVYGYYKVAWWQPVTTENVYFVDGHAAAYFKKTR